jgi:Cupredoxin-like domain
MTRMILVSTSTGSISRSIRATRVLSALTLSLATLCSYAADDEVTLIIENHKFTPAELKVPAQKKIKLVVENRDASVEEFESHALNREKIVPAKGKATIYVGPLTPGRYAFFGDFNPKTAQGVLVAQ